MRILFLAPWFPAPPDNGIRIRLYNFLRVLGQRHSIALLAFVRADEQPAPEQLRGVCESIETVPWREFRSTTLKSWVGLLAPTPRSVAETYNPQMTERVKHALTQPFDAIVASTADTAPYVPASTNAVCVLEEHNFYTGWMREKFRAERHPLKRARAGLTFLKQRAYEKKLYARFDACTMVSSVDARQAHELLAYSKPIVVVPNAMDLARYEFGQVEPQPNTLIFNGSLSYSANLDAVQFFAREIWQLVRAQSPNATLRITGRADNVNLDLGEGITRTGYLDDIRPAVSGAWACIAPLREGSGTRLKILEAMALGTPVIATSKGAEGLNITHGKDILIADTPAEFAAQTINLFNDPFLRAQLAANARALVEAQYDWQVSVTKFESLVQDLVERRRSA
jgi:polysaccharide biosynthesis protein PslH